MQQPVAIVTGASSGIGREIASELVTQGFRVFGSTRNPDRTPSNPSITLLKLDVTSEASVATFVAEVMRQAGRIDLLVNNAGATLEGAVEETDIDQAKALFETNFFGVLRMTLAVLPSMRQRGSGRVITIGSVAGFLPKPFEAIYAASKHALEAWSESLDHEVRQFGVRAILIEPGFIRTAIDLNSMSAAKSLDAYSAVRVNAIATMRRDIQGGDHPQAVAKIVLAAATSASPTVRYLAGKGARWLRWQRKWLPSAIFDWGLRSRFGLHSGRSSWKTWLGTPHSTNNSSTGAHSPRETS